MLEGKHGLSVPPTRNFFLPTLLVLLMLSGPYLALSSSGAGSRNCVYMLQTRALSWAQLCQPGGHMDKHWTQNTAAFLWVLFSLLTTQSQSGTVN